MIKQQVALLCKRGRLPELQEPVILRWGSVIACFEEKQKKLLTCETFLRVVQISYMVLRCFDSNHSLIMYHVLCWQLVSQKIELKFKINGTSLPLSNFE